MSRGSAWDFRRDHAFAVADVPQQRRLVDWTDQGTPHPTECGERRARRLAEVTAKLSAPVTQLKADVSAAVAEALQAARAAHHEEADLAPTTTTSVVISEPSTSIQMSGGASSISASAEGPSDAHDLNLALAVPITCSAEFPGGDNGSSVATASACFQPRDMFACVLPLTATPATSPVPLSTALAEYIVEPASPSTNIAVGPEAPTSATTKPAASAALESDPITALPANIYAVCLEDVPDVPAAVLMQDTLVIADSGSFDPLVSLSASLDKPDGADTAVTHEDEQQLTCLIMERSLLFIAAKDVSNEDSLVTSTSVMPLTLPILGVTDDIIANKFKAIASKATLPNKLLHCDRNLGMSLHPKFRFPMLVHAPWDPGEHAKETQSPILISDSLLLASCLRFAPDQVQFTGGRLCLHIIPGDSKSMSWEDMRIIFQCVTSHEFLALVEHLYELRSLNCWCELWTSWQIHVFIPGTIFGASLCAFLICLKARTICIEPDELEKRLEMSMQRDILAWNCCSIVLHNLGSCSSLQITECPWFLASGIQPGRNLFLATDGFLFQLFIEDSIEIDHGLVLYTWSLAVLIYFTAILIQLSRNIIRQPSRYFSQLQDLLIAIAKLQPWPMWEAYISGYRLQFSTQFGSTSWVVQWEIAWAFTLNAFIGKLPGQVNSWSW